MRYAQTTAVAAERSRGEIERVVTKYGASKFVYSWIEDRAMIGFFLHERMIRFIVPMPDKEAFSKTAGGRRVRKQAAALKAWEQATRQRWRALLLAVKAKLEAVESGIATFEDEFMAYIVLPDNHTVGEFMKPQLLDAYAHKRMPLMLPCLEDRTGRRKILPPTQEL